MPLYPTDEVVSARELAEITKAAHNVVLPGIIEVDAGEYRYDESARQPWSASDNGARYRFWIYRSPPIVSGL